MAQHPHVLLLKDFFPSPSRSAAGLTPPESCRASASFLWQPGWGRAFLCHPKLLVSPLAAA